MKIKIISLLLIGAMLLCTAGCASGEPAAQTQNDSAEAPQTNANAPDIINTSVDLMQSIAPVREEKQPISPEAAAAASDFALRLTQAANDPDRNTLISPLSVLCALAMTANGAENETLLQMESTLGMRRELYNAFFLSYLSALRDDGSAELKLANSIWFSDRSGFAPKDEFLKTNAAYYGADAFLAPFDDSTLREINGWVNQNTDGMIPSILDQIPEEAVMYLVNALAFDAKWQEPYRETDVSPDWFNAADGTQQVAFFMYSGEQDYLSDDKATGFLKYYQGGKYAFAALLPNEGVTVGEYLDSLDGEKLQSLLGNPSHEEVVAAMPKFEAQSSLELSGVLKAMGMELPFDREKADFSSLGTAEDGNIRISRILHKTFISVEENGTRAAAATAVEAVAEAAEEEEPKRVKLDRPFVYMLIDCETNLPFFIGTMLNPAEE